MGNATIFNMSDSEIKKYAENAACYIMCGGEKSASNNAQATGKLSEDLYKLYKDMFTIPFDNTVQAVEEK